MNFLHPAALAVGAGLVALPIAVHLLTRPRPVRLPFSALRFLESALRQRRFFARLRDVLILTARTLLLLALAAAFARPLIQGTVGRAEAGVGRRVVILDVSRSMEARRGGMRVFDRAQALALRYVARREGMRINLILAGAAPQAAFETFSTNYPALQAEVRRAQVRHEALDARGALARAGQMLAQGEPAGDDQVVIITDLQQTTWGRVAGDVLPEGAQVTFEYVGLGAEAGNLGITGVVPQGRPELGRPVEVRVEVRNYSPAEQVRTVELKANGRAYRAEVSAGPYEGAAAQFEVPAAALGAGETDAWITGAARILEARDALPADDVRHFAFRARTPPTYALISREDPDRVGTAAYFLSRMLCPASSAAGAERVLPIRSDAVTGLALEEADLLALVEPGRLGPQALEVLGGLLLRGRPMLYVVSSPADAENLAGLAGACGGALKLPVRFAAWRGAAQQLGLVAPSSVLEPLTAFGDDLPRLARGTVATRALKTSPDEAGAADDVRAAWSDGSAALVVSQVGAGRLVVWNGALGGSSLPRSAFFVVLVREAAMMLLSDGAGLEGAVPVGAGRLLALPASVDPAAPLELVGPDGERIQGFDVERAGGGVRWRWPQAGPPGVYTVMSAGGPVFAVATDCPGEESDLRSLTAAELEEQMGGAGGASAGAPRLTVMGMEGGLQRTEAVETWPWLMVGAVCLMLLELGMLKLFRV